MSDIKARLAMECPRRSVDAADHSLCLPHSLCVPCAALDRLAALERDLAALKDRHTKYKAEANASIDAQRDEIAEMVAECDRRAVETGLLERELAAAVYHRDGARATVTHLEAEVERLREMVREAYSEGQGSVSWAGSTPFKDSSVAFDLEARREP
jgi:N-acyl-D-aspartate/D-glutamate deacylase